MAKRKPRQDTDAREQADPGPLPAWRRTIPVSKEQLAAAERTREYHARKWQASGDAGPSRES